MSKANGAGLDILAKSFERSVKIARTEPTTKLMFGEAQHLARRTSYHGNGSARVFCVTVFVAGNGSPYWFFFIMATKTGNVKDETIPLKDWTTEQQLSACYFRGEIARIEPQAVETSEPEGDGYIFRGPVVTQKSEPG